MKRKIIIGILVIICIIAAVFGYYIYRMWPMLSTTMGNVDMTEEHQSHNTAENPTDGETTDPNLFLRFLKNLGRNIRATGLYFLVGALKIVLGIWHFVMYLGFVILFSLVTGAVVNLVV